MIARPLAWLGAGWIRRQRRAHGPHARPLHPRERAPLEPYFSESVLDAVRIREVQRVSRPWFIRPLAWLGFPLDMDFRGAAGITFSDLVLISDLGRGAEIPSDLLFHELIHVLQYRALGIDGFSREYVRGWLAHGRAYLEIPLEKEAYGQDARFRRGEVFRAATAWAGPVERG